ncbi:MAG: hypothetical protein EA394_03555 [Bacteroidia bacterium]|nr:MAG: hypothetical protein EA394_03555 [Bacteroidia bacterium]
MLPIEVQESLKKLVKKFRGTDVEITGSSPVGGGCINDAHLVETDAGVFFVKYNDTNRYPGMFAAEAAGLEMLAKAGSVRVPRVTGFRDGETYSTLVLEYIRSASKKQGFWEAFGKDLARLHLHKPEDGRFGLDHDNYIGSLPQENTKHTDWISFFIIRRLEYQFKLARDNGRVGKEYTNLFESLYRYLPDFFPEEEPSLLHGDLWNGNFMTGENGEPVIIDPAVYYGHRYMDLGMSKLFGGFGQSFYDRYGDVYPLDKSWEKSMDIANLYPLMVHVNLFGGGYAGSVKTILQRFS